MAYKQKYGKRLEFAIEEGTKVRTSLPNFTFVQANWEPRNIVSGLSFSPLKDGADLEKFNRESLGTFVLRFAKSSPEVVGPSGFHE